MFASKGGCAATSLFSQSGHHAGGVHYTTHSDKARAFWLTLLVLYDCLQHSHHHQGVNEGCGAGMMMSGVTCSWWWGTTLATALKSSPALAKAALVRCFCLSHRSVCCAPVNGQLHPHAILCYNEALAAPWIVLTAVSCSIWCSQCLPSAC